MTFGATRLALAVAVLFGQAAAGSCSEYHIDPKAAAGGDGSLAAPFASFEAARQSHALRAGDRLLLAAGQYGAVTLTDWRFGGALQIAPSGGGVAHFDRLTIRGGQNLALSGLSVWPASGSPTAPRPKSGALVRVEGEGISLSGFDIRGREDARAYMGWPFETWRSAWHGGVVLEGQNNSLSDSQLWGISNGIVVMARDSLVENNRIAGFSQDAMRGFGEGTVFRANHVQDCIDIDQNHDDGFQSWTTGKNGGIGRGVVRDLTLDANVIIEWTGAMDDPRRCQLQGIGLFDGIFDGITITNNIIAVSAYHGIALYGAKNSVIANNTLINVGGVSRHAPWITLSDDRWQHRSEGNFVVNNLAPLMQIDKHQQKANRVEENARMLYPARELNAPYAGDFRPRPDSRLIGRGDAQNAPSHDALQLVRPKAAQAEYTALGAISEAAPSAP